LSLASLPTLAADPKAQMVGKLRRHHSGVRADLAATEDSDDLFTLVQSRSCEHGITDALDVLDSREAVDPGREELVFILPPGS
jgi:LysR family transcriptional regulator, carnitine catabolism transcriptional activator